MLKFTRTKNTCDEIPPVIPPKPSQFTLSSGTYCKTYPTSPKPLLKKKYDFQKAVEKLVEKLDLNLTDNEQESGYGSDLDSYSLHPPPLPKRRNRVTFDSYVLLLQGLRDYDAPLVKFHIRRVSSLALRTEEVTRELFRALLEGQELFVQELLTFGANANAIESNTGLSALHVAASLQNLSLIKCLIHHGASILCRAPSNGKLPSDLIELHSNQSCFAYLRCMEECLGALNGGVVYSTIDFHTTRIDELSLRKGESLTILRKGDYKGSNWWWAENSSKQQGYILQDFIALNQPKLP